MTKLNGNIFYAAIVVYYSLGDSTVLPLFLGGYWYIILWVILLYSPFFWGDTVPISRQPAMLGYQNIIFDGIILLSYLMVLYFFLTFNGTILTLCSTNITCDYTFVTFSGSLFFLTFNGTIFTLCSTNITYNCIFVTFGSFLIFSHLVVSLLFFHI